MTLFLSTVYGLAIDLWEVSSQTLYLEKAASLALYLV